MQIRHQQNLSVLYSPYSVAVHHEHNTFGKGAVQLMDTSREKFRSFWKDDLLTGHPSVSVPSKAYGALSAHILDRDVRAMHPNVLRLLLVADLLSLLQVVRYGLSVLDYSINNTL